MEEMTLPQAIWIGAVQILSAVFPGDLALDVHDRRRADRRHVARSRPRIFLFPLDPDDVRRDRLRFAQDDRAASRGPMRIAPLTMTPHLWIVLAIGFVVAFFSRSGGRRLVPALGAHGTVLRHSRSTESCSGLFLLVFIAAWIVVGTNNRPWKRNRFFRTCRAACSAKMCAANSTACRRSSACSTSFQRRQLPINYMRLCIWSRWCSGSGSSTAISNRGRG